MIDMHLKSARGISYSQIYPNGEENIEDLIDGLPTCESVQWLSIIVHRKTNMGINECEYDIICPIILTVENDLQQRLLSFMASSLNRLDQYIDVPAMLETINILLTKQNDIRHELSKEERSRLFKAYLIICDKYLIEKIPFNLNNYEADDMLHHYMPFALKTNSIMTIKNFMMELVKSKLFLIDFAKSNKEFSEYIKTFIEYFRCKNASEYMWYVLEISNHLTLHKPLTNIIDIRSGHNSTLKSILDIMSINQCAKDIELNMQEKPLYKVDEYVYCVLFFKFFIDKFFHSLIFDLAHVLVNKGLINTTKTKAYFQLKQKIGQKFTEQFLFYTILNRILIDKGFHNFPGTKLEKKYGQGMPDYIAYKAQRVFVFEFKDIQMNSKIRTSQDYDIIINFVNHSLIKNELGKPKGISQLANVIETHLAKALNSWGLNGRIQIYPIIVYTDSCFDIEGFNYYLNSKFKTIMSQKTIHEGWIIKDLIMVNLDTLLMFEKAFNEKKLKFDVLVNGYLAYKNSNSAYEAVPFNKYLFQRGKAKGYFFKTPPIVDHTIAELKELSAN